MARKISTSPLVDQPMLGSFNIITNTLSTLSANENMVLDPNGTGIVDIDANVNIRNQQALRLAEASGNGTNFIAMRAAANMTADYTITWPAAVSGTNGFFLSSDTSGNLSWSSAAGGISVTDPGAVATTYYPFFGTNAGSVPTTFGPNARSNLQFVPSTGELFATIGNFANVYGGTGASATITIRGTSSGTKATASVLMTDGVASTTTGTGTLVVTGGVGISGQITAATIVETSSIAFKENVSPIDNALDKIMQLVGVEYDRKDTKEHETGLIAEQVFGILPDLVSCDENGKPYGLKYTKITAYLVEAIKELKTELDKIKG
jgi:Chaperone of endosialidase